MKTMIRRLLTVLLSATLLLGITNAPLIGFADTASPAASASAPAVRAEHYSIQASLDTKKKLLRQTVTMRVANHSGNPLSGTTGSTTGLMCRKVRKPPSDPLPPEKRPSVTGRMQRIPAC